MGRPNYVLTQAKLWLESILLSLDITNYSQLVFGYIRTDDFWHYSRDVQDLYEVSLRLMYEGVYPKLSYPLEWCTKQDVYDTYYTVTDTELLNSVWVCEGLNEGSPCIDCSKCDERRR